MNDEILSEIESDIDCDWKEISNKIKKKQSEEIMKEPKRFMFPNFREFYNRLVSLFLSWEYETDIQSREIIKELRSLIRRIVGPTYYNNIYRQIHDTHKNMPKGFDYVWDIFCDPYEYKHDNIKCSICEINIDLN